jgi:SAM-dependent methyltransferase
MRDHHFYTNQHYPRSARRTRWYRDLLTRARFHQIRKARLIRPQMKVLDIGCGEGNLVRLLEDAGALAFGIDINIDLVRVADHPRTALARADALPFPDNTFDICVSSHLIEHLDSPVRFLRETARVLRAGGRLALIYPWELVRGMTTVPDIVLAGKLPRPSLLRRIHRHVLSPERIEALSHSSGLRLLHSRMFLGLPHLSPQYISVLVGAADAEEAPAAA